MRTTSHVADAECRIGSSSSLGRSGVACGATDGHGRHDIVARLIRVSARPNSAPASIAIRTEKKHYISTLLLTFSGYIVKTADDSNPYDKGHAAG